MCGRDFRPAIDRAGAGDALAARSDADADGGAAFTDAAFTDAAFMDAE